MNEVERYIGDTAGKRIEFGTGVDAFLNDKLSIYLNDFGEYQTCLRNKDDKLSEDEIADLREVNCLLSTTNENDIAEELFSGNDQTKYDERIGFYTSLHVGHVLEGSYRENASSGGFGTWIFTELLRLNYIDNVIHVKKSGNSEKLFEYSISGTTKEIIDGAKTKYYPVELSEVLKIIKKIPGRYAVIGVPSFIMELRLLSRKESVFNERIKFFIGLVCGHQKSTKFADFLAWQCGVKPGNLKNIDFRKKLDYGPSSEYGVEVTGLIDGKMKTVIKDMKQIYGGNWGKGLFKVKASDFSDDVMNETADLTLGDAWLPEYTKDNKGNNIVVVRNPIIEDIINQAIDDKRVKLDTVDADTIYRSQIAHYRHSRDELGYRLYKKKKKKEWYPKKKIEPSNDLSFSRKRIQDIREKYCEKAPRFYLRAVEENDLDYFKKKMKPYDMSYKLFYKFIGLKKKF